MPSAMLPFAIRSSSTALYTLWTTRVRRRHRHHSGSLEFYGGIGQLVVLGGR
jgi:hypothetical protein